MALLLLAAAGLAAPAARAQDDLLGELKTVASVTFEGRHRVSAKELRSVLKTRAPSLWPWHERPILRPDFVRSDTVAIRERYRLHGYLDASVGASLAPTPDSGAVAVTFHIHEGYQSRIATVVFEGVHSYPVDDIRRKLQVKRGEPFDPYVLQLDTLKISELYQDRGYRPTVIASARRREADSLRVDVKYEVQEGTRYRIGDVFVRVQSPDTAMVPLASREVMLKSGDWYRRSYLVRSWERLYDTGLFSQVQMTPIVDSTRTRIDIDVAARPRKPRWIDAGVGSGSAERYRGTVEWGHRNILGRGLQGALDSRIAFDGSGQFLLFHTEVSGLAPWMLGKRIRGVVTPFFERSDDRANPLYLLRQELHGVRFELRRDINRFSSISLTQDNLWAHQDALAQDTLPQSVFDTLVTRYTTHSLSLGGTWDFRDNPLNPFNGSYHAITGELAGGPLRGTSSFRKLGAVSSWYAPFRNGWVLAARIQGGVIHPFGTAPPLSIESQVDPDVARVPLGDRFRIGGVNSLRGYSESSIQPVGGLAMMLANVELRVPVVGPFGFELYADGGNVWSRPSDINGSDFTPGIGPEPLNPGDVHYVLGLGPRLNLPIGPLRLDLTWPLRPMPGTTRRNLVAQFAIGPTF